MTKKSLFLKWALSNVLLIVGSIAAIVLFEHKVGDVTTVTKVLAGTIAAVYLVMSAYVGRLMWKIDWAFGSDGPQASDGLWRGRIVQTVLHDSEHVFFTVSLLQILGLLGTVIGFLTIMVGGFNNLTGTSQGQIQTLLSHVASGSATAMLCTIVGILTSIVLGIQHHLLMDAIERDASGTR